MRKIQPLGIIYPIMQDNYNSLPSQHFYKENISNNYYGQENSIEPVLYGWGPPGDGEGPIGVVPVGDINIFIVLFLVLLYLFIVRFRKRKTTE